MKAKYPLRLFVKQTAGAFFLTVITFIAMAQMSVNTGFPFITNFDIKKYIPISQSWAVMQDSDRVMYFGIGGLLQYDGVNWTNIDVGVNGQAVRCLAKDKDGRIYAGSLGDLGYLVKDNLGKTKFHSLLSFIPTRYRNFNDIWSVYTTDQGIFFQSRERIFRLRIKNNAGKEDWDVKVWNPATQFLYGFYRDGIYYVHQQNFGLARIVNDSIIAIKGSDFLGKERVQVMLPYDSSAAGKRYLIGAFITGLYLFDGQTIQPFVTEADSILRNSRIYKGILLKNGNYALATSGKGLVIIDKNGKTINIINSRTGLQNDLVRDVYEDETGSVWLALDKGIARLETSGPITQFTGKAGLIDNLNSVQIVNGEIFIGSSSGLFKVNKSDGLFEKVTGIAPGQVFDLLADGNRLLLATSGIYCIENNKPFLIPSPSGGLSTARSLLISKLHPNILFAGLDNSVIVFYRIKEKPYWKYAGVISGINNGGNQIIESGDDRIWIGTLSKGVFSISDYVGKNGQLSFETLHVEHFTVNKNGLSGTAEGVTPYAFKKEAIFAVDSFVYRYNRAKNYFFKDTFLTRITNSLGGNPIIFIDSMNRIWETSVNGTAVFSEGPDGVYTENKNSFVLIPGVISTVLIKEGKITWLAGPEGLIRYDENKVIDYDQNFKTLLRQVTARKDTLNIPGDNKPTITYAKNSLRFDYAATFFVLENQTKYQTWLEGFEKKWSDWGSNTYKEYTNLSEGDYTFHVKAKNVYDKISEDAVFTFTVLPPWYRTWWAYILWVFAAIAAIGGFIYYRSHQLRRENRLLEDKVSLRTSQLNKSIEELKSTQAQLIQSEKMASLGELTAGIAHEIRNPLNFVNNFADVNTELIDEMEEEISKGNIQEIKTIANAIRENNAKITHHGQRADSIVKGMLQHSPSSTGQKEPSNINALADEYLRLVYLGLRAKDKSFNVGMHTDFDNSIGNILIVPQDIGRVLLNLYNNAFYAASLSSTGGFTDPDYKHDPAVWVSTKKIGDKPDSYRVLISVKDNGPGIPQNIIDKIFQPFFTTKPTGEGTGLGLSLSYDIITKGHQGDLKVKSKEGEGATFIISLPLK